MNNERTLDEIFQDSADELRAKLGTQDGIKPNDIPDKIHDISTGGGSSDGSSYRQSKYDWFMNNFSGGTVETTFATFRVLDPFCSFTYTIRQGRASSQEQGRATYSCDRTRPGHIVVGYNRNNQFVSIANLRENISNAGGMLYLPIDYAFNISNLVWLTNEENVLSECSLQGCYWQEDSVLQTFSDSSEQSYKYFYITEENLQDITSSHPDFNEEEIYLYKLDLENETFETYNLGLGSDVSYWFEEGNTIPYELYSDEPETTGFISTEYFEDSTEFSTILSLYESVERN